MDGRVRVLERWIIVLIAIHSVAVGALLLVAPQWSSRFGGWEGVAPEFFTRQAGIFHMVVVMGYLFEYVRTGGVSFLVATKCVAFVFLTTAFLLGERAWAVPVSALADGAMAIVVAAVHAKVRALPSAFDRS